MEERVKEVEIPACHGAAFKVNKGDKFRIIDLEGQQVGDMIAYRAENMKEFFSPAHTRSCQNSTVIKTGDCLFSNKRTPLLKITADTVGKHDMVVPCCDPWRYERDYGLTDHRSCQDNLLEGLNALGIFVDRMTLPEAVNIFMNNIVTDEGKIITKEPTHGAGSYIEFEVLEDLIVAVSACPQDLSPCNAFHPTAMRAAIYR